MPINLLLSLPSLSYDRHSKYHKSTLRLLLRRPLQSLPVSLYHSFTPQRHTIQQPAEPSFSSSPQFHESPSSSPVPAPHRLFPGRNAPKPCSHTSAPSSPAPSRSADSSSHTRVPPVRKTAIIKNIRKPRLLQRLASSPRLPSFHTLSRRSPSDRPDTPHPDQTPGSPYKANRFPFRLLIGAVFIRSKQKQRNDKRHLQENRKSLCPRSFLYPHSVLPLLLLTVPLHHHRPHGSSPDARCRAHTSSMAQSEENLPALAVLSMAARPPVLVTVSCLDAFLCFHKAERKSFRMK